MNIAKDLRSERLIAKRYEEQGYVVTVGPPASAIPFALNHIPTLLAVKGDEHILIAVNTDGARLHSDEYFSIDEEVQKHHGWRLLFISVSDAELQECASAGTRKTSSNAIRQYLRDVDQHLHGRDAAGFVLPRLWVIYISALRLLMTREDVDPDDFTDLSLINKAYSIGVISIAEHQLGQRFMKLRDQAVHSLEVLASRDDCVELRNAVDMMLDQLSPSVVAT